MSTKYLFYINGMKIEPCNSGELSIKKTLKEERGGFYYETTLEEPLKLDKRDYDKIKTFPRDQGLTFTIVEESVFGREEIYRGVSSKSISPSDDVAFGNIELPMTSIDPIGVFLSAYEQTINMMEVSPALDYSYDNTPRIEYLAEARADLSIGSTIPLAQTPIPGWGSAIEDTNGDPVLITHAIYARERVTTLDIAGVPTPPSSTGWNDFTIIESVNNASTWTRKPSIFDPADSSIVYFTFSFGQSNQPPNPPPANNGEEWVLLDRKTHPTNGNTLELYLDESKVVGESIQLNNGRYLFDVIKYAVSKANPDLSFRSKFLTDDISYVTGLPNEMKGLVLHSSEDVKRPLASIEEYTRRQDFVLSDFLELFCEAYNCFWSINEKSGQLIIEHVSYQDASAPIDADKQFPFFPEVASQENLYKFKERTSAELGIDFVGTPIEFLNLASGGKDSFPMEGMLREVFAISDNPDSFPDGILVLVQPEALQPDDRFAEEGAVTGDFIPNVAISQSNADKKYLAYQQNSVYLKYNYNFHQATLRPILAFPTLYQRASSFYSLMNKVFVKSKHFDTLGKITSITFNIASSQVAVESKFAPNV